MKTQWFVFSQNNSGGSFIVNETVAEWVIIEAFDDNHANRRAEDIGIYFDGVDDDIDCECCGDRWYPEYNSGYKSLEEAQDKGIYKGGRSKETRVHPLPKPKVELEEELFEI
jgi:hypothetical protein